ncbi:nitrous oxide reductase family maturation protein NosD [Prosthecomicrobium sp. N25]|uniref:nitrous oxide reductase family maturation protein NosD n=1 Tax=Prosthecomicrobium sp. N25 TaxID=3129254 RepID=UPI003077C817
MRACPVPLLGLLAAACLPTSTSAGERTVPAEPGALVHAIETAEPGDILRLAPGLHGGPVEIDKPLTLDGGGAATVRGTGTGSVIRVTGPDVVLRGLYVTGSGPSLKTIDAGISVLKGALRTRVEGNRIVNNLVGVDVHGGRDVTISGNAIVGRRDLRQSERGPGVYVWQAPGLTVEENLIRSGRDGLFINTSSKAVYRNNRFEELRFAVHSMNADDIEVSGNVSVGNDLGYALMYSKRLVLKDNRSIRDRSHGILLNYANDSTVTGNLVLDGRDKCLFMYNANKNRVLGNRFEGCAIGIHFTAGSDRNVIAGNAFVGNRTQVKYVGTKWHEWSDKGRGNYWSDNAAFDLDGDGLADSPYRPNDVVDQILWSQPSARLLIGSPAVQLIRWSQSRFPGLLPGGVIDSHPLMKPVEIAPDPAKGPKEGS